MTGDRSGCHGTRLAVPVPFAVTGAVPERGQVRQLFGAVVAAESDIRSAASGDARRATG